MRPLQRTAPPNPDVQAAYLRALSDWNAHPFAQAGGYTTTDREMFRRQLRAILANLPASGGVLVDVGTGPGIVPQTIHACGHEVYSIDWADTGGEEPLKRLEAIGITPIFARVGVDPVPLPEGAADVVFAGDVIEHLPASPRPFLAELRRLLRPGGSLVLTTPNATRLHVRAKLLLGYSNWPALADIYDTPGGVHASHHKEYTATELLDALRRAGFTGARVEFVEERLRDFTAGSLADIQTQRRGADGATGDALAFRVGKQFARGLVALNARLAGDLLTVAQRPPSRQSA